MREDRAFAQGKAAAATLIRALSVPDRAVQLAVAKLLVETGKRAGALIIQERADAYEQVRWEPGTPQASALPDLRRWYEGPDAIGAEPVDHLTHAIPA
ncbi:MAG: hypothetical protein QM692_08185 [Thermomicrobiales bacterium]